MISLLITDSNIIYLVTKSMTLYELVYEQNSKYNIIVN